VLEEHSNNPANKDVIFNDGVLDSEENEELRSQFSVNKIAKPGRDFITWRNLINKRLRELFEGKKRNQMRGSVPTFKRI
jgi:hypothetical protein